MRRGAARRRALYALPIVLVAAAAVLAVVLRSDAGPGETAVATATATPVLTARPPVYLVPAPEAIVVGEKVSVVVLTDIREEARFRVGPGTGSGAVAINDDACPSAPVRPDGGGYATDASYDTRGVVVTGCAAGTTEILIYRGETLLRRYPVRVVERTLPE